MNAELKKRVEDRLRKTVGDDGVFAKMYAEDVAALLKEIEELEAFVLEEF